MNTYDTPSPRPPTCADCGHRASLHHLDGCRAMLLGRGSPSRTCGCTTTLRDILVSRNTLAPAELLERNAI